MNIGGCCNNRNVQSQMYIGPYLTQDFPATALQSRIKPYSGWASYKNVKSGNYNRQVCWNCRDFVGYPQTPGLYDLNIVDTPAPVPDYRMMRKADHNYQRYQAERVSTHPGSYHSEYVNYFNNECGYVYPKRYVKGNWPDENLIYTNVPADGCKIIKK